MSSMVELKNITISYHSISGETNAVSDLSFSVEQGEFVCIVGPSGCGKSSILSMLAGLIKPSSGSFHIHSKTNIGYMLQKDYLLEWRNIRSNACLGLEIQNKLTPENIQRVDELLELYGLGDFKNHMPYQLSGGMRQRVALIRTLAVQPDVLLLDEPFSALDYQTRLALSDDIYKIIKKEGKTAIMISHDIGESISLADRIIVLTKRPSVIKNIYSIDLTNKSTPIENRKCKEFSIYYDKIWRDLDVHI